MKNSLIVLAMILAPLLCFAGCIRHSTSPTVDATIHIVENAYPSDNEVEEEAEEIIEDITGLDVDISPGSPEVEKPAAQVNPNVFKIA